jgi:hypothetical protein
MRLPRMTRSSVLTRAKARAMGIAVSDLLGPNFTRLFHDTYVSSSHRAPRAASLVRADVDSPMETRIRLLIVFAGLPEPQVNFILRIADGEWRWRFDLCYPEYKLIIEYDGRQHAFDSGQWIHDLERREWLDQDGWRMIIVVSEDIYVHPLRTLQRVKAALEDRGARVPKSFNQEWTRHFMVRA